MKKGKQMMTRKSVILMLIVFCSVFLSSCFKKEVEIMATHRWNGVYVWTDDETEEFKVLDVEGIDDENIRYTLQSSRGTEEFEAPIKSESGRYVVKNLGPKSVKITLSTDAEIVTIDDMWTDKNSRRMENWTGKYYRLPYGETPPAFGNSLWNGEYVCADTGLEISVYGIKEGYVLCAYKTFEEGEEVIKNLKCLEPDSTKAVFTEGERLVILELIRKNSRIKVTDLYMNDSENKGISGVYKK